MAPIKKLLLLMLFYALLASPANAQDRFSNFLSDTTLTSVRGLFAYPAIQKFYSKRQYKMAWFTSIGVKREADSLLNIIKDAPRYGLSAQDYQLQELEILLKKSVEQGASTQLQEQAELLLTNSFLSMAFHLQRGRFLRNSTKPIRALSINDTALADVLETALQQARLRPVLEGQEPPHLQYQLLKKSLHAFLMLNAEQRGASHAAPDHATTLKIQQITANMERWRWEPRTFPSRYIMVNIPAFRLQVFDQQQLVLESKVIVGKPSTPSPVLDGQIECFLIYPYWTVPRSIAVNEMLPRLKKDPGYLQRHHFDVLDRSGKIVSAGGIDWHAYTRSNFPYTFRQREGTDNALGIVKFSFDNPYSVYLHDTGTPHLFNNAYRALSHGCIRVEKARELAQLLVSNDSSYSDPKKLETYFTQKKRREIPLQETVPLYIRYFTVEYQQDSLIFHQDIYKKDLQLSPSKATTILSY